MKKTMTVEYYRHRLVCIESAIVFELDAWQCIRYETMRLRHYYLKRLLALQLKDFNHM